MTSSPPPYDVDELPPLDTSSRRSSLDAQDDLVQTPPTPHFLRQPFDPSSSSYDELPQPPSELPPYPGPIQYIFNSLDVLNSAIIEAHTGRRVMETSTQGEHTVLADAWGSVLGHITWRGEAGPKLEFGERAVKLQKWMTRVSSERVLLRVSHKGQKFDIYQAGSSAIGLRSTTSTPMLCGIRDPYKYTELVVSPAGLEAGILEVAVLLVILLKSKRPLGADFEQRKVLDKVWRGVDRVFGSIGRAQMGQGGL